MALSGAVLATSTASNSNFALDAAHKGTGIDALKAHFTAQGEGRKV